MPIHTLLDKQQETDALEIAKEVSGIPERLSEREIRLYRVEPKPRSR